MVLDTCILSSTISYGVQNIRSESWLLDCMRKKRRICGSLRKTCRQGLKNMSLSDHRSNSEYKTGSSCRFLYTNYLDLNYLDFPCLFAKNAYAYITVRCGAWLLQHTAMKERSVLT